MLTLVIETKNIEDTKANNVTKLKILKVNAKTVFALVQTECIYNFLNYNKIFITNENKQFNNYKNQFKYYLIYL